MITTMAWALRSPSPLQALLLAGLAIVVTGGLLAAHVVRSVLETRLLAHDVAHLSENVRRQYEDHLKSSRLLSRPDVAKFAADLMEAPSLLRLKIFDPTGRIVWSDEPRLIGRSFPDNTHLARALRGEAVAGLVTTVRTEHEYERKFRRAREIYLPFGFVGGAPAGVVEAYLDAAPVEREIQSAKATLLPILGSITIALYGLLSLAVWRASTTIARTREREHAEMEARLRLVERLRAFGEVAAGATHDLANVFAVISARAQLLRKLPALPEKIKAALGTMEKSVGDGIDIARRLREIRRTDGEKAFEPVSLSALAQDVIDMTEPRWRDRPNVEVIPALDDVPPVLGRPSELREVLTNLVLNALDAMPQGGRLTVATSQQNDQVLLEVTDTGIGMTEEARRKLFTPFFTTKPNGTGLGLSVSYGIVKRHQGEIAVESEEAGGSRFIVKLPVAERQPAAR